MDDLYLAVPTTGGVTASLAAFLAEARERGCEARIFNQYSPIPYARNVMATEFLKSKKQRLWWIDADSIPPQNIWSLPETHGDIVGPLYPRAAVRMIEDKPVLDYNAYRYDDIHDTGSMQRSFWPEIGLGQIAVDAMGTGCMITRRKVFEDDGMLVGKPGSNGVIPFFHNTYSDDGRYVYGNDIDFCLRAKRLGYEVTLNTNILCGHEKEFDLSTVVKMIEVHRGTIPPEAVGLVKLGVRAGA